MPEPEPPAPTNLAFKVVTVVAVCLLLYIGVCGIGLALHKYGDQGAYIPNSLIALTSGFFMLIVAAIWVVLRAIIRKDKP